MAALSNQSVDLDLRWVVPVRVVTRWFYLVVVASWVKGHKLQYGLRVSATWGRP
jgi:hypothetical protein